MKTCDGPASHRLDAGLRTCPSRSRHSSPVSSALRGPQLACRVPSYCFPGQIKPALPSRPLLPDVSVARRCNIYQPKKPASVPYQHPPPPQLILVRVRVPACLDPAIPYRPGTHTHTHHTDRTVRARAATARTQVAGLRTFPRRGKLARRAAVAVFLQEWVGGGGGRMYTRQQAQSLCEVARLHGQEERWASCHMPACPHRVMMRPPMPSCARAAR